MRPIAACWRAGGAVLRDAERHMVGVTVLREAIFFVLFVCRSQPHGRRGSGPRVQWSA